MAQTTTIDNLLFLSRQLVVYCSMMKKRGEWYQSGVLCTADLTDLLAVYSFFMSTWLHILGCSIILKGERYDLMTFYRLERNVHKDKADMRHASIGNLLYNTPQLEHNHYQEDKVVYVEARNEDGRGEVCT